MRNATIVLTLAVVLLYAAAILVAWRRPVGTDDLEHVKLDYRLALNDADADTLTLLPGVGPALAARIVEYRRQHGPFTDPDQLMKVRGIGPAKHAEVSKLVRIRPVDRSIGPTKAQRD